MNNSINFAGFVDMLKYSSDEFEPYGYSEMPPSINDVVGILNVIDDQCYEDDFFYD